MCLIQFFRLQVRFLLSKLLMNTGFHHLCAWKKKSEGGGKWDSSCTPLAYVIMLENKCDIEAFIFRLFLIYYCETIIIFSLLTAIYNGKLKITLIVVNISLCIFVLFLCLGCILCFQKFPVDIMSC